MPLPKLSPLQSRLAASLLASVLVLMLYLALSSSHLAYALEIGSTQPGDHNHDRLQAPYLIDDELDGGDSGDIGYQAEFFGVDRGIIGRAPAGVSALENNHYDQINIEQGDTVYYMFSNASLWAQSTAQAIGLPSPVLLRRWDEGDVEGLTVSSIARGLDDGTEGVLGYKDDTGEVKILPRQLPPKNLYVTINTCLQPADPNDPGGQRQAPAQLQLYVSQSSQNQKPGPGQPPATQQMVTAVGGFANITVQASGDVFIGVYAPKTSGYENPYNVEIAASIDAPFHSCNDTHPNLYLIDSDTTSALLVTNNLTLSSNGSVFDSWMSLSPPFVIFAENQDNAAFTGIQNSYCGLERHAQIAGTSGGVRTSTVQTSMTNKTLGPFPKQQFYFQGLNASSLYRGILAMTGNSTAAGNGVIGGGGRIWQTMTFPTQSDGNCAVIFNLTFCDSVSYAVPGNPTKFQNVTTLADFYDDGARTAYANFDYALQQIPCEIESLGQYSLARNCDDCRNAYKRWLCSVMIPRCMDYSSNASWLQPRNVVRPFPNSTYLDADTISRSQNILYLNSSRNPSIDQVVQPGPYKEILPCDDLCYNIVQSCPSSMQFSCPRPNGLGFNHSYGLRPDETPEQAGQITCNYPGAVYNLSLGHSWHVSVVWTSVTAVLLGLVLL